MRTDAIQTYWNKLFGQPSDTPLSKEITRLQALLAQLNRDHRQRSDTAVQQLLHKHAAIRLNDVAIVAQELQHNKLTFESTETWRTVYEEVLNAVSCRRYFSVALIRSDEYWQDRPGEESLQLNYRLLDRGFNVHRLFIVDDFFWAPTAPRPSVHVYDWMFKQYLKNLQTGVMRLSDLEKEPELICDFGIYGDEAVGYQQTNFKGETTRYEIEFGEEAVRQAEAKWKNLLLYATNFETILR